MQINLLYTLCFFETCSYTHSIRPYYPPKPPSSRAAERNINAILDPWEFAGVTTARTIRIIGHPTPAAEAEIINIIMFEKMYANWPKGHLLVTKE